MTEVLGVFDAKARFSELVDRAERGEETVVTRHGKPVARVAPLERSHRSPEEIAALMEKARALRESIRKESGTVTVDEILAWRDEGRR